MTPTLKARLASCGWGGGPASDVVQRLPLATRMPPPQASPVLPPPLLPPAGWYRCPGNAGPDGEYERWWDGAAWTEHVRRDVAC